MDAMPGVPVAIELRTSDAQIARAFYGPLLGWDIERRDDDAPAECRIDGVAVATVRPDGTTPGAWRMVLADGGPSSLSERVERAGGITTSVAPDLVDVVDPQGATCTVDERAGRVPLARGWARPAWFEVMTTSAGVTDRFYRSVFDYELSGPAGGPPEVPFALLTVDGQAVAGRLALPDELAGLLGDCWMTYVAVRDVDGAAARATQLGATVLTPPLNAPTGRVCALRDPCGAVFTLLTPADSG